ncbi:hypothetical protein G7Y89_g14961 [Cudoniella acicularis]|uniref:N-acetyltransferase domain-containing protein n=1 Tax=Cudoniella acicularis TaxID=354080 RepID=A0A8H4VQA9_9HELO|nr:hypothetical protein G7Y89_g14961 [Cudoniella acicularis]
MASSFRSERLIYRAPEDTPQDKAFILSLQSDRACAENATGYLVKPMSSADVDIFLRQLQDCLLGVLVCLPESSAPLTTKPIGYVNLKSASHPHHRNSTMSIQICREEQGKGYGSEAIKWALEWGFLAAGLHRLVPLKSSGCEYQASEVKSVVAFPRPSVVLILTDAEVSALNDMKSKLRTYPAVFLSNDMAIA